MSFFKGSMQIPDPKKDPLPKEQVEVLDKLARAVVRRGMTVPAILFLESVKPLNYIGSQVMVFFEPIVQTVFNFKDYELIREALERRDTIEKLVLLIEERDSLALKKERAVKKFMKAEKKKWKWYQRWLGIARPRVELPEEIKNLPDEPIRPEDTPADNTQTPPASE